MIKIRRVVGSSMIPTIREGAILIFLRRNRVRVGDVVLANIEGREVVKRVAAISEDRISLLGDNTEASTDSRHYGIIDRTQIYGPLFFDRGLQG